MRSIKGHYRLVERFVAHGESCEYGIFPSAKS